MASDPFAYAEFCQYRMNLRFDSIHRGYDPFLSQGGNSLLVTSVRIAFVLNIAANEKRDNIAQAIEEELEPDTGIRKTRRKNNITLRRSR